MIVDIMQLKNQGLSKRAIARRLRISRDTVSKYWDGSPLETVSYGPRPKLVDPYQNYIIKRLEKYPELSADRLFDEIRARGYKGSARTLRRYVASIRPQKHREYKPPVSRHRRTGAILAPSWWMEPPISFTPLFSHSAGAVLAM